MASPRKQLRRAVAIAGTMAVVAGVFAGLGPVSGGASSHREAPLISDDPKADTTDVWAFVSEDAPDSVNIIGSWIPFEEPAGGPNFYPFADNTAYDINIDNNGNARADIIYRWVFSSSYRNPNTFLYNTGAVETLDDPDLNFVQTYDLSVFDRATEKWTTLLDDQLVVPSYVGATSMPNYEALFAAGVKPFDVGEEHGLSWTGQSDDPFFLDLRVFDLLYGAPTLSEIGDDTLAGFNVNTVALQVEMDDVARRHDPVGNPIIGIWSTTSRPGERIFKRDGTRVERDDLVQISRLANPLVNEVVIPLGMKDRFNASFPRNDAQFGSFVTNPELPALLEALYGLPAPATPRDDLVAVFLTGVEGLNKPPAVQASEMMRLNMSIPPCEPGTCAKYSPLGVIAGDLAGYPNGRRLADDVVDISLKVVEGDLLDGDPFSVSVGLGDGVDVNDTLFRDTFPYVALPWSGSDPTVHT
jgi:hypothetical protein